jgi:hypothetical protein
MPTRTSLGARWRVLTLGSKVAILSVPFLAGVVVAVYLAVRGGSASNAGVRISHCQQGPFSAYDWGYEWTADNHQKETLMYAVTVDLIGSGGSLKAEQQSTAVVGPGAAAHQSGLFELTDQPPISGAHCQIVKVIRTKQSGPNPVQPAPSFTPVIDGQVHVGRVNNGPNGSGVFSKADGSCITDPADSFSDLKKGAPVTLTNESGRVIASTTLEAGETASGDKLTCVFRFNFGKVSAAVKSYSVQIGHVSEVTDTASELKDRGYTFDFLIES